MSEDHFAKLVAYNLRQKQRQLRIQETIDEAENSLTLPEVEQFDKLINELKRNEVI